MEATKGLTPQERAQIWRELSRDYNISNFLEQIITEAEERGRVEMREKCQQLCVAKRKTATVVMCDDAYDAVWEIEHEIRALLTSPPPVGSSSPGQETGETVGSLIERLHPPGTHPSG